MWKIVWTMFWKEEKEEESLNEIALVDYATFCYAHIVA